MKVRVTEKVLKTLFSEGRYIFYDNGTIFRRSDKTFVKRLCDTSMYNWGCENRGQIQYNLFSDKYGVVTVRMSRLLKYGTEHNLLVKAYTIVD